MKNISQKSKEVWAFGEARRKRSHPQSLGVTKKRSWVLSQDKEEQEILCGYPFLRKQKSVGTSKLLSRRTMLILSSTLSFIF